MIFQAIVWALQEFFILNMKDTLPLAVALVWGGLAVTFLVITVKLVFKDVKEK